MRRLLVLVSVLLPLLARVCSSKGANELDEVTVHLIMHSHDDVGWLKTVDQYYAGQRNDIQPARVQFIIDSVMEALEKNPRRKFIYVEIAFFWRWWRQQSEDMKERVRKYVRNGQLEFVSGGWSMNDEATTYYQGIIDQMTLGHKFLKDEFNVIPKVAWQIDPFGHSKTQAYLYSCMGFDAFMLVRIDYREKDLRFRNQELEYIWQSSPSIGKDSEIFTSIFPHHYDAPKGFCFDAVKCTDNSIQSDPTLFDYDLEKRASEFATFVRADSKAYKDSNVFYAMGSDFQYEAAHEWFKNVDILIDFFNRPENFNKYRLKLMYSSPSLYINSKKESNISYSRASNDFFPYADNSHSYWTGYYVSRASFKAYERYCNGLFQICKQIESIALFSGVKLRFNSFPMAEAMAIVQHHDAISGTARQHVSDDYAKRLHIGLESCDLVVSEMIQYFSKTNVTWTRCEYLNISICSSTEKVITNESASMILLNGLAESRSEFIRIPISSPTVEVYDNAGVKVLSQVRPITEDTFRARLGINSKSKARHDLYFLASVTSLQMRLFKIRQAVLSPSQDLNVDTDSKIPSVIENSFFLLKFDKVTGCLSFIKNKKTGKETKFKQSWEYYMSNRGDDDSSQVSGAYIFRPNGTNSIPIRLNLNETRVFRGPIFDEVYQTFGSFLAQSLRLYKEKPFIEIEYTLGPIDVSDFIGKEIVLKFKTDLKSDSEFFTDANGREILRRRRQKENTWDQKLEEPVSGNYYPVNSRVFIQDKFSDSQFTVLTDRSQGASSLNDGEVEIMVNRRCVMDDHRGVGEVLDENIVTRGRYWLVFDSIEESHFLHRTLSEKLQNPLAMYFGDGQVKELKSIHHQWNPMSLPKNLHLVSMESWYGKILLRLGHLFAKNESSLYSDPVCIDIAETFGLFVLEETYLTGTQLKREWNSFSWVSDSPDDLHFNSLPATPILNPTNLACLRPMEIKTWITRPMHHSHSSSL